MANTTKLLTTNARRILSSRTYSTIRDNLWTPEKIVKSPHPDVIIPNSTIWEHIWQHMERWPDKPAVVCGLTNRTYTYHQLYNASRTFAANLRSKLKVRTGDVICIMKHNSPEYAIAVMGILQAGAEVTTVNPIYTAHELQRQLNLSNPKIMIGSPETVKVIKEAFRLTKKELPIITIKYRSEPLPDKTISFQELVEDTHVDLDILKEVHRRSEDIALLPYSSGTTGLPKGVELTNRNLVVNCVQQDVEGVKQYNDTTASHQDSIIAVLPFYHIYGLVITLFHKLSVGAKVVSLPRFQPEHFLSTLRDHRVTLLYAAPPMVLFLASEPTVKREHLDSVQKVVCAAAPLPKQDIVNLLAKKPSLTMLQMYGLTETAPLAIAMKPGDTNYMTVGYAVSNTELKIINSEDRNLGPNELGELLIRGPQVMKGYRNNPEATKNSITEDGWLKTGDLAYLDNIGICTIADRLKELIKVKGYQVPPAELECLLKEHPSVLDAGVIGTPDPRMGEVPKAFIVLRDGHQATGEELKDFVKERVAEFKRIRDVVFLKSIPRNPSGKILRKVLRDEYK